MNPMYGTSVYCGIGIELDAQCAKLASEMKIDQFLKMRENVELFPVDARHNYAMQILNRQIRQICSEKNGTFRER